MMPVQFGSTKVGGMQYGGVKIGEAMMNGQIVYRSSLYPLTGTFNIVNGRAFLQHEVFSHTVVESGNFTGTVTQTSGQTSAYNWLVNGLSQGSLRTFNLSVGDTIKVETLHTGTLNVSGTWSVVKN